jgi:hypothetical protein
MVGQFQGSNIVAPPLAGQMFGSTGIGFFIGTGNPNASTSDSANNNLAGSSPGSLYVCTTAGSIGLWQKTAATNVAAGNPTGVWTQLS